MGSLRSEGLELRIDGARLGLPLAGEGVALGNFSFGASRYGPTAGVLFPVKDLPMALLASSFEKSWTFGGECAPLLISATEIFLAPGLAFFARPGSTLTSMLLRLDRVLSIWLLVASDGSL